MLLGVHVSIAGGVNKAIERGDALKCTAVQIFLKNNIQWEGPPISRTQQTRYLSKLKHSSIQYVFAHGCYLVNLCSPDDNILKRSITELVNEVRRAELLRIPFIVIHPGAHSGMGVDSAVSQCAHALNTVFYRTRSCNTGILVETTSGQGSSVGWRFEHLAEIINRIKDQKRIGVCVDTCHLLTAGYDIRDRTTYRNTFREFDTVVGIKKIRAFHLNDSKTPLGSRRDRHAHIGKGYVGREAFRLLMNDERFIALPKVLETPKESGTEADRRNLKVLRSLVCKRRS